MRKWIFYFFLICSISVHAQKSGFKVGFSLLPDKEFKEFMNGVTLEFVEYGFLTRDIAIQYGIGVDYDFKQKYGSSIKLTDINIPVSFCPVVQGRGFYFVPYIGGHARYFAHGSLRYEHRNYDLFDNDGYDYARLHFGAQAGFDFVIDRLIVGLGAEMDFTKFTKEADNHKVLSAKIGMFF